MGRNNVKPVTTAYWLVFCVFLLYQQPATMALGFSGVSSIKPTQDYQDVTMALGFSGVSSIKPAQDYQDVNQCADWEMYDGLDCVCANDNSSKCSNDDDGMICDDKGGHYKSKCDYALQTCQQKISLDRDIRSCGACQVLRLTGGKDYPRDSTLAKFKRIGPDAGFSTIYRSITDKHFKLFFVNETNLWAIGTMNSTGSYIGMSQVLQGAFPQDANPGMSVLQQNGTWAFDETYQLECVKEEDSAGGTREKRFIFSLITAIVITVIAVTTIKTTLKVVQALKGCLYYPSVCSMRDEIKNKLLPKLIRDKSRFLSISGNSKEFKSNADKIHAHILTIKESIIKIPQVHVAFNASLSSMVGLYSSIKIDFPYLNTILSDYSDWMTSVMASAKQQLVMLPMELMMELPGLIATSTTSLALAASGIGAVLAFAFAIVDVVSSVLEEKRVRDELHSKRNTLLTARHNLDTAFTKIKHFQQLFCKYVVRFLYDLSAKGKALDPTFQSLFDFLSHTYGRSPNRCNDHNIVAKTNHVTISRLARTYLPPLVKTLTDNVKALLHKSTEVTETNAYLGWVKRKVAENSHPRDIFRFAKTNKPVMTMKIFHTLYDILKFISKSVLPKRSCYWGNNLDNIRNGTTSDRNYIMAPVCNSPELAPLVTIMKAGIQHKDILCKIDRQVHGTVFRTKFYTIRFIADYILPSEDCYWGYDLNTIRTIVSTRDVVEVVRGKVDSGFYKTMRALEAGAPISLVRNTMDRQYHIENQHWQTFILCRIWQNQDLRKQLGCSKSTTTSCFNVGDVSDFC